MAIKSGFYFIQNAGTGTVLDLPNGQCQNGTKLQGDKKHKLGDSWVPVQLWVVSKVANDPLYSIQNANTRTYITLSGENITNGTPIVGFEATPDSPNQHWFIYRNNADTGYVIENKAKAGACVNLKDGKSDKGTPVQNWAGEGVHTTNKNRLWEFVLA